MKVLLFLTFVAASYALKVVHITGTTPPKVPCPNSLCNYKVDGNYEYKYYGRYRYNYFVQCVNGLAYCQACWPLHLQFSENCNQCLYNRYDKCVTTQKWYPATTFHCPDKCPHRGPHFSGNIEDPYNPHQYIACWHGQTVGCIACPKGLKYNEQWNACLYEGVYKTDMDQHEHPTTTTPTTEKQEDPTTLTTTTTTTMRPTTTTSTTEKQEDPTTHPTTTTTTTTRPITTNSTTKKQEDPTTHTTTTTRPTTTTTEKQEDPTTKAQRYSGEWKYGRYGY